jgi:hypothetical protein
MFFIWRPNDAPGLQQDSDYETQLIQRAQDAANERQRARRSLGQTLAQGLADGLNAQGQTYTFTDRKVDNEHGIAYCYYRNAAGGAFVQQQSVTEACPYEVRK